MQQASGLSMHPGFLMIVQRFANLTLEEANALYQLFGTPYSIHKKEFLMVEGQKHHLLYFIHNGYLRGFYRKEAEEITTNFYFGPNFVADLTSIRENRAVKINIQALEDLQVQVADFSKVEELALQYPSILRFFLKFVEHLYMFSNNRQLSFCLIHLQSAI